MLAYVKFEGIRVNILRALGVVFVLVTLPVDMHRSLGPDPLGWMHALHLVICGVIVGESLAGRKKQMSEHTRGPWEVSTYRTDIGGMALVLPRATAADDWDKNIRIANLAPYLYELLAAHYTHRDKGSWDALTIDTQEVLDHIEGLDKPQDGR